MPEMSEEQRRALMEKLKGMGPEELREFQKKQCIFCQIVAGKMQAKKLYEDERSIAILDINPAALGHVLLLPKEHYAIMPQVPEQDIGHLGIVAKHLSRVLLKAMKAQGTTVFIANGLAAGQRAQHLMLHIIPRAENDQLGITVPQRQMDDRQLAQLQEALLVQVNKVFGIRKEVVKEKQPAGGTEEQPGPAGGQQERPEKMAGQQHTGRPARTGRKAPAKEKKRLAEEREKQKKPSDVSLDDIAGLFS